MANPPVGKCTNFRACSKADSRQAIPLTARDPNPVCPECREPLLITTPIVNPRRNALVAVAIVAVVLCLGIGLALRHSFTHGPAATVAVAPTTIPASGGAPPATVPTSATTVPPTTIPASAVAAVPTTIPTRAGSIVSPSRPGGNVAIPTGAPPDYANLVRTADKLDPALYFSRDSGLLDSKASADIGRLASVLKSDRYRARKVVVTGFADNTGGDADYSKLLSKKRAQIVALQLTAQGVAVAQTLGFGDAAPVGDNATREGRKKNRRVEVFVTR